VPAESKSWSGRSLEKPKLFKIIEGSRPPRPPFLWGELYGFIWPDKPLQILLLVKLSKGRFGRGRCSVLRECGSTPCTEIRFVSIILLAGRTSFHRARLYHPHKPRTRLGCKDQLSSNALLLVKKTKLLSSWLLRVTVSSFRMGGF